jgi:hypothetical protein
MLLEIQVELEIHLQLVHLKEIMVELVVQVQGMVEVEVVEQVGWNSPAAAGNGGAGGNGIYNFNFIQHIMLVVVEDQVWITKIFTGGQPGGGAFQGGSTSGVVERWWRKSSTGTAGTANTGGGGGGGGQPVCPVLHKVHGGSGIVIIRYKYQ